MLSTFLTVIGTVMLSQGLDCTIFKQTNRRLYQCSASTLNKFGAGFIALSVLIYIISVLIK